MDKESKELEISKAEERQMAVAAAQDLGSWGESEMTAKDMSIGRINLMQPGSVKVTEGDAAFGDFIESNTGEKLGDVKNPIKVIPFHMTKLFVEYDNTNPKKKKFMKIVPITPANESLPFEGRAKNREGVEVPIVRDYTLNFFVLFADEIKEERAVPRIITFRRTSLKAGRKLATQMFITNRAAKLPPPGVEVTIGCSRMSNGENTWAVQEVYLDKASIRRTTDNELVAALNWYKSIASGATKVKDEDYAEGDDSPAVEDKEVKQASGPAEF